MSRGRRRNAAANEPSTDSSEESARQQRDTFSSVEPRDRPAEADWALVLGWKWITSDSEGHGRKSDSDSQKEEERSCKLYRCGLISLRSPAGGCGPFTTPATKPPRGEVGAGVPEDECGDSDYRRVNL
jgi:hypothetical protein